MGACTFSQFAYGKTADDAYRNAVEEARREFGTDPYNGTIATTRGFFILPRRSGRLTNKVVREWRTEAINHPRVDKWGDCACLQLPKRFAKGRGRGVNAYLFAGWAAE